ncbi:lytic transglycosylase domain-containing protein [Sedimentimonas flavescens]|uniref:Lytic transglycosylase domain-containing protein n=1 Tax=Sedimentimonas flavescens TaxID=2851012 RepID=A0ABT3A184_9RHOB|nr:lytic transglycosylase domain-containing protein [Sedimentimonas flavescens]MBW0158918.1 lytic transglycosylase domain-containing protein [Sedimentimonas flavescens]MCV2879681.1 lytic transglycosylase domain-containing protein [Sedimentimonas flavescens]WBL33705.1 lytic transglycosylase domain-containing protein [Sinirhodobacter sp. HNIBRBA609]
MQLTRRSALLSLIALAACGSAPRESSKSVEFDLHPGETPELRRLINRYADEYEVPRSLVHRVIQRESDYNPGARNGPYYGLMQILPQTARGMGFDGKPTDLLDAETNLKYAVKYLRGAWLCADGSQDAAVKWYASGYYYEAKRRGILRETGLRA